MKQLVLVCFALAGSIAPAADSPDVGQPVPFSHRQHIQTAHLKCNDCHKLAASGEVVSVPQGKLCMACHSVIASDSSAIKDLKGYIADGRPIPWVRVYEIPSFVEFSHRTHLDAKVSCETCHGAVASRDNLHVETDMSMGGCTNCHRTTGAKISCHTCHSLEDE